MSAKLAPKLTLQNHGCPNLHLHLHSLMRANWKSKSFSIVRQNLPLSFQTLQDLLPIQYKNSIQDGTNDKTLACRPYSQNDLQLSRTIVKPPGLGLWIQYVHYVGDLCWVVKSLVEICNNIASNNCAKFSCGNSIQLRYFKKHVLISQGFVNRGFQAVAGDAPWSKG